MVLARHPRPAGHADTARLDSGVAHEAGSLHNKQAPKAPTVGESLKAYSSDCLIKNELDGLLGHFLRDRLKVGHHLSLDPRSSIILNVT